MGGWGIVRSGGNWPPAVSRYRARGANISFRNFHFELPPFENIAPNVEVNMAIISLIIAWSWLIFHTHGFLVVFFLNK